MLRPLLHPSIMMLIVVIIKVVIVIANATRATTIVILTTESVDNTDGTGANSTLLGTCTYCILLWKEAAPDREMMTCLVWLYLSQNWVRRAAELICIV